MMGKSSGRDRKGRGKFLKGLGRYRAVDVPSSELGGDCPHMQGDGHVSLPSFTAQPNLFSALTPEHHSHGGHACSAHSTLPASPQEHGHSHGGHACTHDHSLSAHSILSTTIITVAGNDEEAALSPSSSTSASAARLTKTTMIVRGICCPSEVPIIEQILVPMPGVTSVRINVIAKKVVVEHEEGKTPAASIVDALNRAHLDAIILVKARGGGAGGNGGSSSDTAAAAVMSGAAQAPPRPRWNVMLAALLWIVSLISHGDPDSAAATANATTPASIAASTAAASAAAAADAVGHDVRHDAAHGLQYLKYVALGAVALTLPPLFPRALSSLRRRIVDINVLLILAVVGAIAIGDYTEAAAVVVLFALSDYLEMRATAKVRNEIASLVALCPQTAVLADTGESVLVEDLSVGVSVLVRGGDKVPVDGVVLAGRSALDESNLTGESRPVAKGKGDTVSAGTVNVGNSTLTVESRALAEDSAVARLVKLVEDAQMKRSPTEQLVQSVAK